MNNGNIKNHIFVYIVKKEFKNFVNNYHYKMKKVLLMFTGLPRSYKKCVDNIFTNLIIPNKDKYEFKIYINTQTDKKNPVKEDLYEDLKLRYNRFNQLQEIIFYDMPEKYWRGRGSVGGAGGCILQLIRCHQILEKENNKIYDFYIMLRPDMIIHNILILDNYINTFLNVTGSIVRRGHIHNRDWEALPVGYKESFLIYSYLQFLHVRAMDDLKKKYEETTYYKEFNKWRNENTINYSEIRNKYKLNGDKNIENTPNHINFVKNYYEFIAYLNYKNFNYKLSEWDNIIFEIIR